MSSKFIIFLSPAFLLFSCGVKSSPRPPEDTILPSITSQYMNDEKDKEEPDKVKIDKAKDAEGSQK